MNDPDAKPPALSEPPPIPPEPVLPPAPVIGPPPVVPPPTRVPPRLSRFLKKEAAERHHGGLLDPEELERFRNLLIFAQSTVEGYFVGKHKSPYRGASVEFTDYKEYVAGDEVSRIDWRAYGRSRRLFVRQYEAETDMVIYLLVDVSASMNYAGLGRPSKFHVAAKVAAALAYLMIHQGDKAALALFGETLNRFLASGGTRRHLHNLVNVLERAEPAAGTGIARALRECVALFRKRGRIVVLSDFWTPTDEFFEVLGQFLHRKFEVLLLHVLDPDELNLPSTEVARFHDMESRAEVEVEVDEIRTAYRAIVRRWLDELGREAGRRRVDYAVVHTSNPYFAAIEAYLGFRGANTLARS